jgi:type IV pilus assembly protein PilQ
MNRSLLDAALPQAVAQEMGADVLDPVDQGSDEPVFEELVEAAEIEEIAEEETTTLVEDDLIEEEAQVIELETERQLSSGIDVAMGDEGEDLISITLDDVPLQDVVRMFTRISGANIVAGTNLAGSVTVSLQDVEWEPAFRVILDSVDMVLVEKTDGIYSIMSKSDLATEPVTVDTVFLSFSTVSNVMPVVSRMLVSTNSSVSAFPSANALVIQETVARLNTIKSVIEKIDLPRPQVYIETKFVELNDSAIKDLGIDWSALGSDESGLGYTLGARNLARDWTKSERKVRQDSVVNFDVGRVTDSTRSGRGDLVSDQKDFSQGSSMLDVLVNGSNFETVQDNPNGSIQVETIIPYDRLEVLTSVLTAEDFEVTLSALNQDDGVDVISNPKVIVANEETASIHVGRNEPNVVAVPQGDTGDRYAFTLDSQMPWIEIGVKLEVTPTVNTEDNITVRLTPELSRLIGQKEVGEGATKITFPVTQIRKVNTQFNLESGNTVAIGGLSEASDVEKIKKIPLLGDIPFIGKYLFTHTHTEKVKDEVIIFVTVGMAEPENLVEVAGVPSESELIHEHLARQAATVD